MANKYISLQSAARSIREKTDWDPFHPLRFEQEVIGVLESLQPEDVIPRETILDMLDEVSDAYDNAGCRNWYAALREKIVNYTGEEKK